jgi:hypothetical protein
MSEENCCKHGMHEAAYHCPECCVERKAALEAEVARLQGMLTMFGPKAKSYENLKAEHDRLKGEVECEYRAKIAAMDEIAILREALEWIRDHPGALSYAMWDRARRALPEGRL